MKKVKIGNWYYFVSATELKYGQLEELHEEKENDMSGYKRKGDKYFSPCIFKSRISAIAHFGKMNSEIVGIIEHHKSPD